MATRSVNQPGVPTSKKPAKKKHTLRQWTRAANDAANVRAGIAISKLKPKAQKVAMKALQVDPEYLLPGDGIEELVNEVLAAKLPEDEQATVVETKLQEAMANFYESGEAVDRYLAKKKIRDINPTAFTIRKQLENRTLKTTEKQLAEIIKCREYLSAMNKTGLIRDLTEIASRYTALADQLKAAPAMVLPEREPDDPGPRRVS